METKKLRLLIDGEPSKDIYFVGEVELIRIEENFGIKRYIFGVGISGYGEESLEFFTSKQYSRDRMNCRIVYNDDGKEVVALNETVWVGEKMSATYCPGEVSTFSCTLEFEGKVRQTSGPLWRQS